VSTADKIGLLPGFGWLVGHGFFTTLAICWLLTPVAPLAIQRLIERRSISLKQEDVFVSFFPGDLFLGFAAACILSLARSLPVGSHWYGTLLWQVTVLVLVNVGGASMTYLEWYRGQYSVCQIVSPTKIYHDRLLIGGFGYVVVSALAAIVCSGAIFAHWYYTLGIVIGLIPWLFLFWFDQNALTPYQRQAKSAMAHRGHWYRNWLPSAERERHAPRDI
jgi:hypothetical protein